MGTRNLTVIIKDSQVKLSQYGQWDGYFNCAGKKFTAFVKDNLQNNETMLNRFKERVDLLKAINDTQSQELIKHYEELKKNKDFMMPFNLLLPQLSRDTGVDILSIINGLEKYDFNNKQGFPVVLMDFREACQWCEFVYIINLDSEEVYMLTSHKFNGKKFETCPIITKGFGADCCWYKCKINKLPSIKTIEKYYNKIGL